MRAQKPFPYAAEKNIDESGMDIDLDSIFEEKIISYSF